MSLAVQHQAHLPVPPPQPQQPQRSRQPRHQQRHRDQLRRQGPSRPRELVPLLCRGRSRLWRQNLDTEVGLRDKSLLRRIKVSCSVKRRGGDELDAATAMADMTCELIFVSKPKLPRDCVELRAIRENLAARWTYCSIATKTAPTTDAALAVRPLRTAIGWGCRL